jgi:hypothetical protein
MNSFLVRIAFGHTRRDGTLIDAVELAELERLARVYFSEGGSSNLVAGWYRGAPEGATVVEAVVGARHLHSAVALARELAAAADQSTVAVTVVPCAFSLVARQEGPRGWNGDPETAALAGELLARDPATVAELSTLADYPPPARPSPAFTAGHGAAPGETPAAYRARVNGPHGGGS